MRYEYFRLGGQIDEKAMNKYGEEGWEAVYGFYVPRVQHTDVLVGAPMSSGGFEIAVFKRPKEEQPE